MSVVAQDRLNVDPSVVQDMSSECLLIQNSLDTANHQGTAPTPLNLIIMTSSLIWITGVLSVLAGSVWVYANFLLPESNGTTSKDSIQIASQTRVAQQDHNASLPSLIVPCITSHRRTIPVSAIHSFSYPLIYLGLDLDDLESGKLDLPQSRAFIYGANPWKSVLGIQKDSYLATVTDSTSSLSFRQRLVKMLAESGVEEQEVGRVWMVTMPSYIGKSGINPLTTYFVYRKAGAEGRGKDGSNLLCMVLEVHNTFEERYVQQMIPVAVTC